MNKENLFNWCDFYNFADTFSDSNNSAELRSAISRMYYAIFCKSRDYIIENNYYLSKDSKKVMNSKTGMVHSETIKILMNHNQFLLPEHSSALRQSQGSHGCLFRFLSSSVPLRFSQT